MPAKALLSVVVLVVLLVAGLWWGRDHAWLQRWWPTGLPMPSAAGGPSGGAATAQPRKCVGPDRVLYTDGACPAGTRAQAVDGGSLTVLPAPAAAERRPGPAAAASVQTPLRRLAGDGGLPDQTDRRVDQAMHR